MNELYTEIPYVNKPVSRILFGTASTPFINGQDQGEILDEVLKLGIQTFDTARKYGASESTIGNWMTSRGNRDQVVILSKCGHPNFFGLKRVNKKDMQRDLDRSLHNLQTDYIDIYLLHRDNEAVPVGNIVEIFNEMHAEGHIGAFGASNWTHERIMEANEYAYAHNLIPFTVSSPNFGLAEQIQDPWGGGCVSISGKAGAPARKWYEAAQMPVIAYSSLGRGLFSGKIHSDDLSNIHKVMDAAARKGYACEANFERLRRCEELAKEKQVTVSQIAMAWIFKQNLNAFAIVSSSSIQRMKSNLDALKLDLSPKECKYLNLEVVM